MFMTRGPHFELNGDQLGRSENFFLGVGNLGQAELEHLARRDEIFEIHEQRYHFAGLEEIHMIFDRRPHSMENDDGRVRSALRKAHATGPWR